MSILSPLLQFASRVRAAASEAAAGEVGAAKGAAATPVGRAKKRRAAASKALKADKPAKEPTETAKQGEWGERVAEAWLVKNAGLRTIGRRVKVSRDEFDLIMEERTPRGRVIVFVEVKTRKNRLYGGGFAAVDRRKRHALCRAATRWMRRISATPFRIDVVCVYGDHRENRVDEIVHQRRAVPLEQRYNAYSLFYHPRRWE